MRPILLSLLLCSVLALADDDNAIPLEKVGAMLEAARTIEKQSGGEAVDLMELIDSGRLNVELDRYSGLLDGDEYQRQIEELRGRFAGLGITINSRGGTLRIVSVMPNGPSAKSGLAPGDIINKIDGMASRHMPSTQAVKLLRGHAGSTVTIEVDRAGETETFALRRGTVKLTSVKSEGLVAPGIGWIRVQKFTEETRDQLQDALKALLKDDMKALILDLRDNPGGSPQAAVAVCGHFIRRGSVVATSVTDEGKKKTYKSHRSKPDCTKLPLVVLVNGRSASSSEIVAACMQDLKRGLLIGRPTFGKGVGQSITSLIDGSGVKVTTTRFYSPTGRSVDGKGLKPDISCASSRDVAVAIRQLTAELEGQ